MDRKIFALPVIVALAVLIGTQMFAPAQPQAQPPAWDVTTLDLPFAPPTPPVVTPTVTPAVGPGYRPASNPDCNCVDCKCADCKCGELEKRVAALETKVASYGTARPVVSNGSAGASAGVAFRPSTTDGLPYGAVVTGERVVSSRPTATLRTPDYQSGQPVRNVVRGVAVGVRNTTCRVVNSVEICN